MLLPYYFYWFRIDIKHMTLPWLEKALMDLAYRSDIDPEDIPGRFWSVPMPCSPRLVNFRTEVHFLQNIYAAWLFKPLIFQTMKPLRWNTQSLKLSPSGVKIKIYVPILEISVHIAISLVEIKTQGEVDIYATNNFATS